MRVHPLADRFPMMSEAELIELAADIKANGLAHALVLDHTGEVLVDGRNRLEGCKRAGVEPRFERLGEDVDLVAYILSLNVTRRHLNAGQRAILIAIAYPIPRPGKRTDLEQNVLGDATIRTTTLAHARCIVRWAPGLVEDILAGSQVFSKAFQTADKERERAEKIAEDMAFLQREAADLHAIVLSERGLTAAEAVETHKRRVAIAEDEARRAEDARREAERAEDQRRAAQLDEKQRQERAEATRLRAEREQRTALLQRALTVFNPRGNDPRAYAERLFSEIDLSLWPLGADDEASIECWAEAARTLTELVRVRKDQLP
jgi:hypothetical protein